MTYSNYKSNLKWGGASSKPKAANMCCRAQAAKWDKKSPYGFELRTTTRIVMIGDISFMS